MNAVMPGHSPQFASPYGKGLADGVDQGNPHYDGSNAGSNSSSRNSMNSNSGNDSHNPSSPDSNDRHRPMSSAAAPTEFMKEQQPPQQIQQSPSQQLTPSRGPVSPPMENPSPFGLGHNGSNSHLIHDLVGNSYPWSIGSTDGSFSLINLQQHQQQLQMQQQHEEMARLNDDTGGPSDGKTAGSNGSNDSVPQPNQEILRAQEAIAQAAQVIHSGKSLYHDKLFHQSSSSVEGVLAASCDAMGFDIAEMWLRTGLKTHQLTNSHLRPTALQDSVRQDIVDVYYGERSNERTHRLSPALCKRAKDANDVVWVTAHTQNGAEALRMSISNVRTAVAVPVCHEASNTNVTIIYFSIRPIVLRPAAVEFLIHISLSAAVTSVNALSTDGLVDPLSRPRARHNTRSLSSSAADGPFPGQDGLSRTTVNQRVPTAQINYRRPEKTSVTGAKLDLEWRQLMKVEYLTDGGNSWIHTAMFNGKPVVVKTLRPECQDTALAINEIESEIAVHSRVNHTNIVSLIGAGWTSKKARFIVLERLDGGTLTQLLGYDTRIRDRRRRFWKKKQIPYLDVLRHARSLALALHYLHTQAVPGGIIMHRDLKPDNIGFTLDGQIKLIDFGLARVMENANAKSNERYEMSGETGSLRYMAPEVAEGFPYNHKADVYSFGVIFWEMNAGKRPFSGLSRDSFYEQVVHGGSRPHLSKRWPSELNKLIADCWNVDSDSRPTFEQIIDRIDDLLSNEKGGKASTIKKRVTGIIDRHSTWF